jgi:hypothetical protein
VVAHLSGVGDGIPLGSLYGTTLLDADGVELHTKWTWWIEREGGGFDRDEQTQTNFN